LGLLLPHTNQKGGYPLNSHITIPQKQKQYESSRKPSSPMVFFVPFSIFFLFNKKNTLSPPDKRLKFHFLSIIYKKNEAFTGSRKESSKLACTFTLGNIRYCFAASIILVGFLDVYVK
jgi:hypothetical protein